MDIRIGDRVFVNLAPFIGSFRRHPESIVCCVLAVDESKVEVRTEAPCREFSLGVASSWIEGRAEPSHAAASDSSGDESAGSGMSAPFMRGQRHRRSLSATAVRG